MEQNFVLAIELLLWLSVYSTLKHHLVRVVLHQLVDDDDPTMSNTLFQRFTDISLAELHAGMLFDDHSMITR